MSSDRVAVRGAERVVQALEALGLQIVFGLPGVHNLAIWRALAGSSIRLIGVRHEQTAGYAADGYARATGRLGVALVTTGPGAANTLAATGEAMASGSPVLVIATDIPSGLRRPGVNRGVLHESRDQTAMFATVTRSATRLEHADQIRSEVFAAGTRALTAPHGPVYLGIPTDLLTAPAAGVAPGVGVAPGAGSAPGAEVAPGGLAAPAPRAVVQAGVSFETATERALLADAARRLSAARRPLIWAGGGALRAGAGETIGALAQRLAAPVITTYASRGLLPPAHPCAVPGPVHHPAVGALWDQADLVLGIGTDFDGMMTQNWAMPAPPHLIAVNVDAADAAKNYIPDQLLVGDAAAVSAELLGQVSRREGLTALGAELAAIGATVAASVTADEPQAAQLLDALERVLPTEAVVVADMCIPGYWLAGFRRVSAPRTFAYPVGWGTLGFAFPASLGTALAGGGPVVCVTGDGGFLFACGELATIREARIPLTVVLVDDGGYGMLRFDQTMAGEEPFGVDLVTADFPALAAAFGIASSRVTGFGPEFEAALAAALGHGEAHVLVVDAHLKPPLTTSPRWYRRRSG